MFRLTICLLLLIFLYSTGLKSQVAAIKVNYLVTVGNEELFESNCEAILFTTGVKSIYFRNDGGDSGIIEATNKEGDASMIVNFSDADGRQYYTDHSKQKLLAREVLLDEVFLVEDDVPDFQWQVSAERKVIAGYPCVRANGSHRGREYTAWFTLELPLNAGPWKFSGLPGLILEVYDKEGRFNWYCRSIKKPQEEDLQLIAPPKSGKVISFDDYFDLRKVKAIAFLEMTFSHPNVEIKHSNSDLSIERTKH